MSACGGPPPPHGPAAHRACRAGRQGRTAARRRVGGQLTSPPVLTGALCCWSRSAASVATRCRAGRAATGGSAGLPGPSALAAWPTPGGRGRARRPQQTGPTASAGFPPARTSPGSGHWVRWPATAPASGPRRRSPAGKGGQQRSARRGRPAAACLASPAAVGGRVGLGCRTPGAPARERGAAPPGQPGPLPAVDRLWLAALPGLIPRPPRGEVFAVTPATLLGGTAGWSAASGITRTADVPDGRSQHPPSARSSSAWQQTTRPGRTAPLGSSPGPGRPPAAGDQPRRAPDPPKTKSPADSHTSTRSPGDSPRLLREEAGHRHDRVFEPHRPRPRTPSSWPGTLTASSQSPANSSATWPAPGPGHPDSTHRRAALARALPRDPGQDVRPC